MIIIEVYLVIEECICIRTGETGKKAIG